MLPFKSSPRTAEQIAADRARFEASVSTFSASLQAEISRLIALPDDQLHAALRRASAWSADNGRWADCLDIHLGAITRGAAVSVREMALQENGARLDALRLALFARLCAPSA